MHMSSFDQQPKKPNEDAIDTRAERLTAAIDFLKRIDVENIVENKEKKSAFIQNISFDEFNGLLLRINGILRKTPTTKREFNAGPELEYSVKLRTENGEVSYNPPPGSIKMTLLEDSLHALQRMDAKHDTYHGALMMGSAINAIHPFDDGNGRTARFISMLIASSKDNFVAHLSNPEVLQSFIENYLSHNAHDLGPVNVRGIDAQYTQSKEINRGNELEFMDAITSDASNMIAACRILVQKTNGDFNNYITPDTRLVSFRKLFADHGMEAVLEAYREFKKEYVSVLIDIFENPRKYPLRNMHSILSGLPPSHRQQFANMTLLDVFNQDQKKYFVQKNAFSWDYLKKFINGEAE